MHMINKIATMVGSGFILTFASKLTTESVQKLRNKQ
jgi:hypothetical protein